MAKIKLMRFGMILALSLTLLADAAERKISCKTQEWYKNKRERLFEKLCENRKDDNKNFIEAQRRFVELADKYGTEKLEEAIQSDELTKEILEQYDKSVKREGYLEKKLGELDSEYNMCFPGEQSWGRWYEKLQKHKIFKLEQTLHG